MPKPSPDDLLTAAEAARLRGVSERAIIHYANLDPPHNLPAVRLGRTWVFRRGDVLAYRPRSKGQPRKPVS